MSINMPCIQAVSFGAYLYRQQGVGIELSETHHQTVAGRHGILAEVPIQPHPVWAPVHPHPLGQRARSHAPQVLVTLVEEERQTLLLYEPFSTNIKIFFNFFLPLSGPVNISPLYAHNYQWKTTASTSNPISLFSNICHLKLQM